MESSDTGWWHRHGWTVAILLTAFGFSFAIRTIWAYPVVAQWGPLFTYAGGSDSYYHSRVMEYIIQNHRNLIHDPRLNFPFGAINPREPLFDWMNAILGLVFAPFFGGNAVVAGAWFLDLQGPLWAALGVIPVYLIGREVASRRAGLLAALIYPFLSANIDSSIFGYANYLSFYTFLILVVIYCYIRTVKAVGSRRWVESYRHPRQYVPALRAFARTERTAVKWAVFTGVSLGALALAWQGYTYAVAVIGVSIFVAMIAERIRRVDSFGLYVATWIVGLIGFPMAMPYYVVQQQFTIWFDLPLLLYFGVLLLLLPFLLLRDVPWVFSIPLMAALVVGAAVGLAVVSPTYFTSIVTGQGYFVKNLIYSTVAEAQAPSIDQLIIGYGVVTFFLAFVGLAVFFYTLVHGRFKRYHVVFLVFAILSIYLPISASKFFLLGSPIFALLPAEALRRALDIGGYPELRRTVASLSDRRSQFAAFRKAFKVRHVVILVLVVALILPNVWTSIDAGIPGNTKSQASSQVAATLPPWLQLNTSNPSSYYFGAAGSSLDTPNQYDSAGYNWLSQQDVNVPPAQRPAFVSWWDYGFQAIAQGNHPSVADNFQDGIDPAGQFLLAQNESQAIGVLTTTLLSAEQTKSGLPYLPAPLNAVLASDGLNLTELHTLLANTSADLPLVIDHPDRYLPVNPTTITATNAMYLAMAYFLATSLPLSGVAKVYDDVQQYTGWSIRYAMSDSRLFPFSGTQTGIFYAPADLTGRIVNAAGMPTTFFNVTVITTSGSYPAGQVPPGAVPVNYQINYFAPFYNSMIYHTYIGYNGTDAGLGPGIPGLSLNAPLMPGWMLEHFQVVYRTAYYCPQKNAPVGSSCYSAENLPTAVALANRTNGSADTSAGAYFGGGETMLEYYPGQTLLGQVVLPDGTPVSGARVTVDDGWGIPHMTTLSARDGSFSVVLPPGNDTLNITMGTFGAQRQQDSLLVRSIPISVPQAVGLSTNAPNLVETFPVKPTTLQGFVYLNANNTSVYAPHVDPLAPGAQVVFWGANGTSRYTAVADASGSFEIPNVAPAVYNYNVIYRGYNYSLPSATATPGAPYNATVGLSPGVFTGHVVDPSGLPYLGATVTLANANGTVASTVTNASGIYHLREAGVGNYTLTAFGLSAGLRSAGIAVTAKAPGAVVVTNLTVGPTASVSLKVLRNGVPVVGVPVRFVPIATYTNASVSPLAYLAAATSNGTVVTSGAGGTVTAVLPPGTYSVYALASVGGTLVAGLADVAVSSLLPPVVAPLVLAPALRLGGTVLAAGATPQTDRTAVIAYAPGGGESVAWTDSNRSFSFLLPAANYSLLALSGPLGLATPIYAALASADLTGPTSVRLAPVASLDPRFSVGSLLANGTLFPAAAAVVSVSLGPGQPAVSALADPKGHAVVYVPGTLPSTSSGYCVSVDSAGFAPTSICGLSPSGLSALTRVPLSLRSVSVTLRILGPPSGTPVTVNFTAQSPTATNLTLSGAAAYSFSLPPGVYGVGASAHVGNQTVYLPPTVLSTTIPLGASVSNLTLVLVPQVTAKGVIHLPASARLANATVALSSTFFNVTVNGTAFESGFYAAPGTYSAYANVTVNGTTYTNLTSLSIAANGATSPGVSIDQGAVDLTGRLSNATGATVDLNTTVSFTSPSGATVRAAVTSGGFRVVLPPGVTYSVAATGTGLTAGPNGSFYQSWSSLSGAACSSATPVTTCSVTVVPTTLLVWLNGTLSVPGVPGAFSGTVRMVGPYPSLNTTTVVSASNGTFRARVLPGAYSLFATGGATGLARSGFASAVALPRSSANVTLSLAPTWNATVALASPNGTAGVGPVTLVVSDVQGDRVVYTGLSPTGSVSLALPVGTYVARATAPGSEYGVVSDVVGSTTFAVVSGNVVAGVALATVPVRSVSASVVGPGSATVRVGSSVTFSFTVRNTGNAPVVVHPVGSPAYWSFNFSIGNVLLQPGSVGASVSGEVTVSVPGGTPVDHPPVAISFALGNGTVIGQVTPAPVIRVLGYYGVALGPGSATSQVGSARVLVPFYVLDTGNQKEYLRLTVTDAPRLASYGWTSAILNVRQQHGGPITNLTAGENETFFVELNASGTVYLPPGTVTVSASVLNASGSISATITLGVGVASVRPNVPPNGSAIVVTGPGVGIAPAALPPWLIPALVFVPALALALGVIGYRWWRTRRWTHR